MTPPAGVPVPRDAVPLVEAVAARPDDAAPLAGDARPLSPPRHALGYRPALDGLRAVFVLMVMAFHLDLIHFGGRFVRGGFLGVDGFFVLSGFLITALLCDEWERTGRIGLGKFYARRALRLLPAVCVVLIAALGYAATLGTAEERADIGRSVFPVLFYYANWAAVWASEPFRIFGHAWSLSVEEQFYLLWPAALIVLLTLDRTRHRIALWIAVAVALAAVWRYVLWHSGGSPIRVGCALDTRADTLLVGCLIGVLVSRRMVPESPRARWCVKMSALVSTALLALLVHRATEAIGPSLNAGLSLLVALAFGSIVLMVVAEPIPAYARLLEWAPLIAIGQISYGLYLWHWPLYSVLRADRLGLQPGVAAGLQVCAAFAAAGLSYWLIERPFLGWKRAFRAGPRHE